MSHLIAKKKNFPTISTKNRQVINRATKRAHREPRPIHTPITSTVKPREGPPDIPENAGEGGNTHGQSTPILIGRLLKVKTKTAASPIEYHCSALNVHTVVT